MTEVVDPGGYRESEDMPGAVVIPSAGSRSSAPKLSLVTAEIDDNRTAIYDHAIYLALASGRMKGVGEEDLVLAAEKLTKRVQQGKLTYDAAIAESRQNGQVLAVSVRADAEGRGGSELQEASADKANEPDLLLQLKLPTVRVTYEGAFGIIQTRYHSAERCGNFLVLLFDKDCTIVDMYTPPSDNQVLAVSIGDGQAQQKFNVQSLGINLDLDPSTYNIHVIALVVLPDDHPLLKPSVQEDEDDDLGLMSDQSARALGQTNL